MGNSGFSVDRALIKGADTAVERFLEQWTDNQDYITAHTSGSTGTPKEIRLLKADMMVSARATCRYFGITEGSHLVMPLSADYIAGKMMIVRALCSGARLTIIPPSRTLGDLAKIEEEIDLIPIVPTQIEGLLANANPSMLRGVLIGGAPLSPEQEHKVASAGFRAYATYGMTETCSHVALRLIGVEEYFEAMSGISFEADPEDCLIIIAPEYFQRKFVTNDIVEILDATHFRWRGRRDHVINTGGIKVLPEEVEACLRPYFSGVDFYITSRPSAVWGQEIVMVTASDLNRLDFAACIASAAEHLPHYMLPKDLITVPHFQLTSSGKIMRLTPDKL